MLFRRQWLVLLQRLQVGHVLLQNGLWTFAQQSYTSGHLFCDSKPISYNFPLFVPVQRDPAHREPASDQSGLCAVLPAQQQHRRRRQEIVLQMNDWARQPIRMAFTWTSTVKTSQISMSTTCNSKEETEVTLKVTWTGSEKKGLWQRAQTVAMCLTP